MLLGMTKSDMAGPRALFLNLSVTSVNVGLFLSVCSFSASVSPTTP